MRIVITCGPAIAPIDEVRRITNFSTGELGVLLANAFSAAGHEVICWKGEAATSPLALAAGVDARTFSANGDLAGQLAGLDGVDVIFHAAALCDYEVAGVYDGDGNLQYAAKIPSRAGDLVIRLKSAQKILPTLRETFPHARIAGWKYELNGTRDDVLAAGRRQLAEARSDLCVVNGAAYGSGFGVLDRERCVRHFTDKVELCAGLVTLTEKWDL